MLLADLGAEAPKNRGRDAGEFRGASGLREEEEKREEAAYYAPGRNKKSIILNLKSEGGREIFYRLSERADVVIEGFTPGMARRLGIDYQTASKLNPSNYCSISGYGRDGPYHPFPGHDVNHISMAGILDLIGVAGPLRPPH